MASAAGIAAEAAARARRVVYAWLAASLAAGLLPSPGSSLALHLTRLVVSRAAPPGVEVAAVQALSGFWVPVSAALYLGLYAAVPLAALEAWRFLSPALYPCERRALAPTLAFAAAWALAGLAAGPLILAPLAVRVSLAGLAAAAGQEVAALDAASLVSFALKTGLALAAAGLAPLASLALAYAGVDLQGRRGILLLVAAVAAAVASPDPTGLGMLALTPVFYWMLTVPNKLGLRARACQSTP